MYADDTGQIPPRAGGRIDEERGRDEASQPLWGHSLQSLYAVADDNHKVKEER